MKRNNIINIFQAIADFHCDRTVNLNDEQRINYLKSYYKRRLRYKPITKKQIEDRKRWSSYLEMLDLHKDLIMQIKPNKELIKDACKNRSSQKKRTDRRRLEINLNVYARKQIPNFYCTENWRSLRQLALKRDKYKCWKCKSTEDLHVHHLKGKQTSNRLRDLVTLCKYCHGEIHPFMNIVRPK